ncbi:sia-alpha-2,3-Gal-beta-1,4-GlcNAc-R:alpha 2,8-sialyltransferase-like [Lytechinus variegatus]|uniref:sia-alpha-2,3-Gal-beta-1,4-GlcNAc-R:alpha 2,8-sialyltransferase-like n=1 Tax=Lytechinus variegatus TaxID=7654 RepID=UPI001BB186E2|nr:sia-alpha-2,3-Gal-beta-1,4-GlcNAc-R:alpha 2,8-sialyltransferase-like [Lytechinus variegatus]XP_041465789.1 sia-alpha-2,3-Gal-beta-1,4-GlcNAc-R:alpha 2,8-sialyltransferase-like [Lytechinus variegatus]
MPYLASLKGKQFIFGLLLVISVMLYIIILSPEGPVWPSFPYVSDRDAQTSLWNFRDIGQQQLYLYDTILKYPWKSNSTRRDHFRQELANYRSELGSSWSVVLHQENVTIKDHDKYVFHDNYNGISPELYKLLPKKNPLLHGKRYRSCAVVGNSGTVLHSGCGKEIDMHDFIFRCNIPPLMPFERDAGIKSNFSTMNPSILFKRYNGLKKAEQIDKFNYMVSEYRGVLWSICHASHVSLSLLMTAMRNLIAENLDLVCANPMHVQAVTDFWYERNIRARISSGFYLVTLAIQVCDEVTLYGFWPFSERYGANKTSVSYHYFDKSTDKVAKGVHSMDKEFALLMQLHDLGIIRINIGPCK